MRQCQCGGLIREHQLTGARVAWTCASCGRYEAISLSPAVPSSEAAFEWWFAGVIHYALNEEVVPDDYLWDLNDAEDWRQMHRKGMTAVEAIEATFRPGFFQ